MRALPRSAAWSTTALCWLALLCACRAPHMSERDADAPVTAADGCSSRNELCNGRDDDCDGVIDEVQADGSCRYLHARGRCNAGSCVIDRCSAGYFDCNQVSADGCEARAECGTDPAVQDSGVSTGVAPDAGADAAGSAGNAGTAAAGNAAAGNAAAGSTSVAGAAAGSAGAVAGGPAPDDADGGTQPDAGSCEQERCDSQDNDCDGKVDEGEVCDKCVEAAATGQGELCDRCVCESCPYELTGCNATDDSEWNTLCADVLVCFGKSVKAGLCTGDDSDCFQNGDGPCASEFLSAFRRGISCGADPVRTPCGALTHMRLSCYRDKCADVCKR